MRLVIYAVFFFATFKFVLGESYPYHNVTLFVNEFFIGRPGSNYIAVRPGGVITNSRYFEAMEYWKSLIAKSSVSSTLVDACYNRVCQTVVLQEIRDQFLNIEVRTKVFSRNVTGYTLSQLLNPSILNTRYQPTTIIGKYRNTIKRLVSKLFRLISFSWEESLRIDNILLGQYPGWTIFVTRKKHHNSGGDTLSIEQISCITRLAIQSPQNSYKVAFCIHVVDTQDSQLDIRLFKDDCANFADPWGLPCSEVDNPSEFELDCVY